MTDKKLLKIVEQFTKGLTDGVLEKRCYMITLPLQGYLSMCGIETELIHGEVQTPTELWDHFWLKLEDGRILDPTAGQFKILNLPKIYLGILPSDYKQLS